jgi:hypothetical protein
VRFSGIDLLWFALAAEVLGILLGKVSPLLGQIVLGEDGRDRADRNASAAVNALDRVNEQLIGIAVTGFVFLRVNAIDRTGVYTGGVLGADTRFCNDICHLFLAPGISADPLTRSAIYFTWLIVAYGTAE